MTNQTTHAAPDGGGTNDAVAVVAAIRLAVNTPEAAAAFDAIAANPDSYATTPLGRTMMLAESPARLLERADRIDELLAAGAPVQAALNSARRAADSLHYFITHARHNSALSSETHAQWIAPLPDQFKLHTLARQKQAEVREREKENTELAHELVHQFTTAARVNGTPGEAYIRTLGVRADVLPNALRWNGSAIMCAVTDARNTLVGLTLTTPDGQELRQGATVGGAVRLRGSNDRLVVTMNLQDGLAIHDATGLTTYCHPAASRQMDLSDVPTERLVIVADHDLDRIDPRRKHLADAVKRWRAEGRKVMIMKPHEVNRQDGGTWVKLMLDAGPEAVAERIRQPLPSQSERAPALPVDAARQVLGDMVRREIGDLLDKADNEAQPQTPHASAIRVSTGAGKTEQAVRAIVHHWREQHGRLTVAYFAPNHKVNDEIKERLEVAFREAGTPAKVAIWRGRSAKIDERSEFRMCDLHEQAEMVVQAGGDVATTLCRNGEYECPFYQHCEYMKQRSTEAHVWVLPHSMLWTGRPKTVPEPAIVIVDESPWLGGTFGTAKPVEIHVDALAVSNSPSIAAERLLVRALYSTGFGGFWLSDIHAEGITEADCSAAINSAFARREKAVEAIKATCHSGMTAADIARCVKPYAGTIRNCDLAVRIWRNVRDMLRDRLERSGRIVIRSSPQGGPVVQLVDREQIDASWTQPWNGSDRKAVFVLLDANYRDELARQFLPDVRLVADIVVDTPHLTLVQHYGRSFALNSLFKPAAQGEQREPQELVEHVAVRFRALSQMVPGSALFLGQKMLTDHLRDTELLTSAEIDGTDTGHFNNIRGVDAWGQVGLAAIVGRTLPRPAAVEAFARALSGRWIDPLPDWYATRSATVTDQDDNPITLDVEFHPDPLAEAVRASICEDELTQAIGRVRAVNRTARDPVEVHVFGNVLLDVEVSQFQPWREPNPEEWQAANGWWLQNAGWASKLYPDKYTRKSLRRAREHAGVLKSAGRSAPKPYKDTITDLGPTSTVTEKSGQLTEQQLRDRAGSTVDAILPAIRNPDRTKLLDVKASGRGQRASLVMYDKQVMDSDPEAFLLTLLGEGTKVCRITITRDDPADTD
jgi:PAS domain-containing protein